MSNVTINDFVRYRELKAQCQKLARQVDYLECQHETATREKVKGSLPYFPYTEQNYSVVGIINNTAKIEAKRDTLDEMMAEGVKLLERLTGFLQMVDDEEVRETLELYYIDGLTYSQVAEALGLEGDGTGQMRSVHRYMRKRNGLLAVP